MATAPTKLTAIEAKALTDGALDTFAESLPDLVVDYLRIVKSSEDAETMRRAIELVGKLRGIAAEKQTQVNLPTVNISFGAGMVISSTPTVVLEMDPANELAELTELCEPVKDPLAFIKLLPTKATVNAPPSAATPSTLAERVAAALGDPNGIRT